MRSGGGSCRDRQPGGHRGAACSVRASVAGGAAGSASAVGAGEVIMRGGGMGVGGVEGEMCTALVVGCGECGRSWMADWVKMANWFWELAGGSCSGCFGWSLGGAPASLVPSLDLLNSRSAPCSWFRSSASKDPYLNERTCSTVQLLLCNHAFQPCKLVCCPTVDKLCSSSAAALTVEYMSRDSTSQRQHVYRICQCNPVHT